MADRGLKLHRRFRRGIQAASGLAQNSYLKGFFTGKIYKGPLKSFCLPGMNCHSCPGAVGACPIGALQAAVGGKKRFSFCVLGCLALVGVLLGRFVCGWLCLFGLVQELLYKIPTPKLRIPERLDKRLRYLKYFFLLVFVFLLTGFVRVENGLVSVPYFCKYICPVGMLEGGIPLVAQNSHLQSSVGWRYGWKAFLLALTAISSIFIYRPFCKYVCPLGAFYGIFQKFSFLRLTVDKDRCIGCSACTRRCRMNVDVVNDPNSSECIRCGECTKVCPKGALSFTLLDRTKKAPQEQSLEDNSRRRYIAVTAFAFLVAAVLIFSVNSGSMGGEYGALSFTAKDIYGADVKSSELFSAADVTLVNVWASYCSPCIKELPQLSQLNKELQELGGQIVTVLWDSDSADTQEAEIALEVLENGGVGLMCLLHNDTLEELLGGNIVGVPTSFLVDSNGNLLTEPKTGSDSKENYMKWINGYLNKLR